MNKFLKTRGLAAALVLAAIFAAGGQTALFAKGRQAAKTPVAEQRNEDVTILAAAAASLKNAYDQELIPQFQAKYPWIKVSGTYDSSGKLQTQIENGLHADVFMSAAVKQMDALVAGGYIEKGAVDYLLQNKLVLIKPAGASTAVGGFADVTKAKTVAIGDPKSVPAGQYAEEALKKLGVWDKLPETSKSLGTNVTEVLSWVGNGSAEVGIVYATDAASTDKVTVIETLAEGILSAPVIYPVAVLKNAPNPEAAKLFVDFLASDSGLAVFQKYGFSRN
ncbi:MAG: molybdate ABC transporter substrate-binding protein [Spirochaetaceae bacterium]|jgi:molybdate transport system substrate-binding protein|nr:molybdate ABC transporter substrate-binding protein [Spirochaetaceae bacterium]